jgi:hypothetical protein
VDATLVHANRTPNAALKPAAAQSDASEKTRDVSRQNTSVDFRLIAAAIVGTITLSLSSKVKLCTVKQHGATTARLPTS